MARIAMNYELAMAAGKDAANRSMRDAGRSAWNEDDWNIACATFNKCMEIENRDGRNEK